MFYHGGFYQLLKKYISRCFVLYSRFFTKWYSSARQADLKIISKSGHCKANQSLHSPDEMVIIDLVSSHDLNSIISEMFFPLWMGEFQLSMMCATLKIVFIDLWRCRRFEMLYCRECIFLSRCSSFVLPIWIRRLKAWKVASR